MKSIKGELFQGRWVEIDPLSAEVGGSWQGRNEEGAPVSEEPPLVRFVYDRLREKENPVLLDVGANTGTMSLLGAFLPNLFSYAFEPVPSTFELLQRNVFLNGLQSRARLYNMGLSDRKGESSVYLPSSGKDSGLATLSSTPSRFQGSEKIDISVMTLDDWMREANPASIDVLKIDTEGHELYVLRGARELLERFSPVIVLEYASCNTVQFGYAPEEIDKLLLNFGYRGYRITEYDKVYAKRANLSQVTRASSPSSSRPAAITLLTIPRGFEGDVGMRQRNAIGSWLALTPRPEVILFGDDPGVAEAADELGVEHIPWIEKTSLGTPLFSDVLLKGQGYSADGVVVYVNTDIILFDDFTRAIAKVQEKRWSRYLLIGQRQNLDLKYLIDFSDPQWANRIKDKVRNGGELASTGAKDYFVFPKGMYEKVPPFAVGRAAFDDWMVAAAIMKGVPVADLTDDVLVVHQNHDYQHIVEDSSVVTMADRLPEAVEAHPEVKSNRALYDADAWFCHTIDFATWQMRKGILKRRFPLSGILWELFFYAFKAVGSFIKQLFKYRKIINYNYWNLYLYRAAMVKERYYTFTRNKYFQAVYYFFKKRF
ncbi:MAG: FkbM family methyltransferase [Synergistaceae bacterium]|jgi:FkbM family methyltransferase|nr:FkbM family methyltransferase [Synergistaceae bacterium]